LNEKEFNRFKGHPLFVSGESYAGHYIPQIGNALWQSSMQNRDINLKGLAIGNGWMTPNSQAKGNFAYFRDNMKTLKVTNN
jgi:cathepsin A (carboxypeptidase C)